MDLLFVILLLLGAHGFAALKESGDNGPNSECTEIRNGSENWHSPPSCFRLISRHQWRLAMSCIKISVNVAGSEIHHGSHLNDVQGDKSFLSSFATGVMNFFTTPSSVEKKTPMVCLSPFEDHYVRIRSDEDKSLGISVTTVLDRFCVACLFLGTVLFFSAENLSRSVKFYYTSGVSIGLLASLLVLVFLLSRLVPKKPAAYTILLGGWSLVAWIFRLAWINWQELLMKYYLYFLIYIGVTGFCSFAFCYWKGPIENPRTKDILKWAIQIFSLFLIYNGTRHPMVSVFTLMAVLTAYLQADAIKLFSSFKRFVGSYWRTPSPRRLLTEEEYRHEAEIETQKALAELRKYCNSPECSPWKTLSKMKSRNRFIGFMDGEDHVTDAEVTLHDEALTDSDYEGASVVLTDDENEVPHLKLVNGTPISGNTKDPYISEDED